MDENRMHLVNVVVWVVLALIIATSTVVYLVTDSGDDQAPPRTTVQALWFDHYPWELKDQYDDLDNCADLQATFDFIYESRDGWRRKYGANGYQIMDYLDERMRNRGCY